MTVIAKEMVLFYGGPISGQRIEINVSESGSLPGVYEYTKDGVQYLYTLHQVYYTYIRAQLVYVEREVFTQEQVEALKAFLRSEIKEQ